MPDILEPLDELYWKHISGIPTGFELFNTESITLIELLGKPWVFLDEKASLFYDYHYVRFHYSEIFGLVLTTEETEKRSLLATTGKTKDNAFCQMDSTDKLFKFSKNEGKANVVVQRMNHDQFYCGREYSFIGQVSVIRICSKELMISIGQGEYRPSVTAERYQIINIDELNQTLRWI